MLSRSVWLILVFRGTYTIPMISVSIIFSLIDMNSMLGEVDWGMYSAEISLYAAPPLDLFIVMGDPFFL